MTTITVCTTCRVPDKRAAPVGAPCGEAMLARVREAAHGVPGVAVQTVACLMGCEHGCNLAIASPGKMTYVLGRFDPDGDGPEAAVAYAAAHAASTTGVVPFREWPAGVRGHFVARIPPLETVAS